MNLEDYRNAPSNVGPLAGQWADKPHRLIYDLCSEIERLQSLEEALSEVMRMNYGSDSIDVMKVAHKYAQMRRDRIALDAELTNDHLGAKP